jgi:hypothetical protein
MKYPLTPRSIQLQHPIELLESPPSIKARPVQEFTPLESNNT